MLVDKGYDPQYGARPMRRAIERLLEDPIAEAILRGDLAAGIISQAVRPEGTDKIDFRSTAPQVEKEDEPKKPAAPKKKKASTTKATKTTTRRKKVD